jgi:hypothetical protein
MISELLENCLKYKVNVKFRQVRTLTGYVIAKLHVNVMQFRTQRMNADRVRITGWFEIQRILEQSKMAQAECHGRNEACLLH